MPCIIVYDTIPLQIGYDVVCNIATLCIYEVWGRLANVKRVELLLNFRKRSEKAKDFYCKLRLSSIGAQFASILIDAPVTIGRLIFMSRHPR